MKSRVASHFDFATLGKVSFAHVAVSSSAAVCRQMQCFWGVTALLDLESLDDIDASVGKRVQCLDDVDAVVARALKYLFPHPGWIAARAHHGWSKKMSILARSRHPAHKKIIWRIASFDSARFEAV